MTAVSVVAIRVTSVLPRRMTPSSLSVREQAEGDFRAAFAALGAQTQPVPVDRHHRRLGDREEAAKPQAASTSAMTSVDSGMSFKQRAP